jgi:hypothetical protein
MSAPKLARVFAQANANEAQQGRAKKALKRGYAKLLEMRRYYAATGKGMFLVNTVTQLAFGQMAQDCKLVKGGISQGGYEKSQAAGTRERSGSVLPEREGSTGAGSIGQKVLQAEAVAAAAEVAPGGLPGRKASLNHAGDTGGRKLSASVIAATSSHTAHRRTSSNFAGKAAAVAAAATAPYPYLGRHLMVTDVDTVFIATMQGQAGGKKGGGLQRHMMLEAALRLALKAHAPVLPQSHGDAAGAAAKDAEGEAAVGALEDDSDSDSSASGSSSGSDSESDSDTDGEDGDPANHPHRYSLPPTSIASSIRRLFRRNFEKAHGVAATPFRQAVLYTQAVDRVLRAHMECLRMVYDMVAREVITAQISHLSLGDFTAMLEKLGYIDDTFTRESVKFAFVLSKMVVKDENTVKTASTRYTNEYLSFVDFLEALARVALAKPTGTLKRLADRDHDGDHDSKVGVCFDSSLENEHTPAVCAERPRSLGNASGRRRARARACLPRPWHLGVACRRM